VSRPLGGPISVIVAGNTGALDTRRKYETRLPNSSGIAQRERIGHVAHSHAIPLHEYPDDVEAVGIVRPTVTVDPDRGGADQLALLTPIPRHDGIAEFTAATSLPLDDRPRALALHDEVDVPMPAPKPPLHYAPPAPLEPSLGDLLPQLPELLFGR